ncbi:MAG TPA: hypothetical protein VL172_00030 [Kofleriaceae bacterium]|jgi:hypothetical protein|nr:hypothetical protein [Kofleriaceae bacterium]
MITGRALPTALLALLLSASAARADPRDEAAAEAAAGDKALAAHDPAGALAHYQAAYAKYPTANLRFNMGLALVDLDRPLEAVRAFEDFLSDAKDPAGRIRDFAAAQIVQLDRKLGRIRVILPAGVGAVKLRVDGQLCTVGRTRALPGAHEVRADAPGRRPFRTSITVAAGATTDVTVELPPLDLAVRDAGGGDGGSIDGAPRHDGGGHRARWWLLGGLGVVAVGALITTLVLTSGEDIPDSDLGAVEPQF